MLCEIDVSVITTLSWLSCICTLYLYSVGGWDGWIHRGAGRASMFTYKLGTAPVCLSRRLSWSGSPCSSDQCPSVPGGNPWRAGEGTRDREKGKGRERECNDGRWRRWFRPRFGPCDRAVHPMRLEFSGTGRNDTSRCRQQSIEGLEEI